jgi:two-component system response regulator ResD
MPHIRNILIVENDTVWIKTLQYYLQDHNVRFFSVATVKEGKAIIAEHLIHLALIDRLLGDNQDGIELLKWIKQQDDYADIQIAILSMLDDITEKKRGFAQHVDEYIVKSLHPFEIQYRILKLLARTYWVGLTEIKLADNVVVDLTTKCLVIDQTAVRLEHISLQILKFLFKYRGKPVAREPLLRHAGIENIENIENMHSVDDHIQHIRKILGKYSNLIITVKNIGFMLV